MIYDPIIKVHEKKFLHDFDIHSSSEDECFEKFVNYSIFLQHQPDAFISDSELFDLVCVGGGSDGGIDGLAIKVNGFFIKSQEDIEGFLNNGAIDVEFLFIQSKNKKSFESEAIASFINGIRAFFDDESKFPFNEKVAYWREIREYIFGDDVIIQWNGAPSIRCYYVTLGEVRTHIEHEELVRQFKKDILNYCENVSFIFQGAKELKDIIDQNQNKFKTKLPFLDSMALPGTQEVGNSCIVLCSATDYVSILNTSEGIIRKTLFNDNVRDYQGDNSVNNEIFDTIRTSPERFVLYNNGVTIVCSSFESKNRELTIENPQIVNGCQTSYILFNSLQKSVPLDEISLIVKVIATNNGDLSNDIVKGTNRQNIVYEEAFECTKPFHKNLESFVNSYAADFQDRIYYERRAKQYYGNPSIRQTQIFNLKVLTQYSVAALLQKPYKSHLHEAALLKEFSDSLYKEEHSSLPYFAVAYSFLTLEKLIREESIQKYFIKYKAHILMIYFRLIGGKKIDLNNERASDKYADKILSSTYDLEQSRQNFQKAIEIFREAEHYWTQTLHKSFHSMKDTSIFTDLIIKQMDDVPLASILKALDEQSALRNGVIDRVIHKGGKPFGFILSDNGDKIYFSCKKNPYLNTKDIIGRRVSFQVTLKNGKDRIQAYNIKVI